MNNKLLTTISKREVEKSMQEMKDATVDHAVKALQVQIEKLQEKVFPSGTKELGTLKNSIPNVNNNYNTWDIPPQYLAKDILTAIMAHVHAMHDGDDEYGEDGAELNENEKKIKKYSTTYVRK